MPELNEEEKVLKEIGKEMKKDKKDNVIYTSFLETDEYILEEVLSATHATSATDATDAQFLVYNKKTGTSELRDNFLLGGKEYCPIVDELLLKGGILLPSGVEEYNTDKQLIEEITTYFHKHFQVPPFFENFLPYLIMFYWVYEKFPFVPYLHFVGLTGTGKTTAEETLGSICYKPIDSSGSITVASVFRVATQWHGTLLLDEFDPEGDNYSEMMALLKSGVANKVILRTEGEKKKEVMVYVVKSPKIFTSERPIKNAGLRSRALVIQMEKSKRRIPLLELQEHLDEAQHLRNKLLLWRLRNLNSVNLKDIEYGFPELEAFDRRVQQVITPIYYLSDDESKKKIVEFAKIQEEETKRERQESLEGQIFQIIADIYPETVTLVLIKNKLNEGKHGQREIDERKIAPIVRTILGFNIDRIGHENIRTVILDGKEDRIAELYDYFGIKPSTDSPSVASVATVASVADNSLEDIDNINNATLLEEEK